MKSNEFIGLKRSRYKQTLQRRNCPVTTKILSRNSDIHPGFKIEPNERVLMTTQSLLLAIPEKVFKAHVVLIILFYSQRKPNPKRWMGN